MHIICSIYIHTYIIWLQIISQQTANWSQQTGNWSQQKCDVKWLSCILYVDVTSLIYLANIGEKKQNVSYAKTILYIYQCKLIFVNHIVPSFLKEFLADEHLRPSFPSFQKYHCSLAVRYSRRIDLVALKWIWTIYKFPILKWLVSVLFNIHNNIWSWQIGTRPVQIDF